MSKSENIKKMEREAGAKKTSELTVTVWLRCCGAELAGGHLVGCEYYPMEAP
jgi:hypothetical protein